MIAGWNSESASMPPKEKVLVVPTSTNLAELPW
jgi:hypothetical protein